jgi:alanyl-tRNA synthetase
LPTIFEKGSIISGGDIMPKYMTGAQIRKTFIEFFEEANHTFVPSSSLVPGGDQTLLFTNAGMVQFKEVFLGTDQRDYKRAVNSQKCMRVAGKHNDLDDVGRDDSHHTFFEMLGNWSFGDYYKPQAIEWAWRLLTDEFGLDRSKLYATCFKDDIGDIPADEEAAEIWRRQPGMLGDHVLYYGRKENFWEMADTGPCGPCSEIHIDLGPDACDKNEIPGHQCSVNGDCKRFLEIWNLVFIQYNRLNQNLLEPLPAKHVDTGMGFERIVSLIQGVNSNYRTDLIWPMILRVQGMTGHKDEEREANFTPYRVIADHVRAASFLIADGVVPGNTGRNYVCRMIIRRAARFGGKLGLHDPFMARVAEVVMDQYSDFYPELAKNRGAILDSLTREEERFARTVEAGMGQLQDFLEELKNRGGTVLEGRRAFDLYATHGLPLELTRDVAQELGLDVDQAGFKAAMEEHRIASGAGKAFGLMGGEDVDVYRSVFEDLQAKNLLGKEGVSYDPYSDFETEGELLAILREGQSVSAALEGDQVEVILPKTCFYIESGGQVSDHGMIVSVDEPRWKILVEEMRRPAAGVIAHCGRVIDGTPRTGDKVIATVNSQRRKDIMRNHTATHLLHAELHEVLGEHARQAGSLVAPDRLRFDFNHSEAMSAEQIERVEAGVNSAILENYNLQTRVKGLQQAIAEGAMALFGEKYGEQVRTVTIGGPETVSYELCGGTHVSETGDIGLFLIISEGSVAAGIRRIEAVTGRGAYELVQKRFKQARQSAGILGSTLDDIPTSISGLVEDLAQSRKIITNLRQDLAALEFERMLEKATLVAGTPVLAVQLTEADADILRLMTDRFRNRYLSGVVVLASAPGGKPIIIGAITDDLVKRGLHAGDLVKRVALVVGGSGGGRPNLAQAGGKDAGKLADALDQVVRYAVEKLGG